MKSLILFIGLILCISCSGKVNSNQKSKKNKEQYSINGYNLVLNSITESEYKELSTKIKSVKINKNTDCIKQSNKLTLPLDNGNSKVLHDKKSTNEIDDASYSFIGNIESLNQYVVNVSYYETSECLLIDQKTGDETKVWGEPIISPDLKHLFSYSDALGYDVMPNGIQMWKYEGGKLKLDWELKSEEWKPQSIEWLDNSTLIFTKIIPKEFSQKPQDIKEYIKLKVK